jgi:hypothetical protein
VNGTGPRTPPLDHIGCKFYPHLTEPSPLLFSGQRIKKLFDLNVLYLLEIFSPIRRCRVDIPISQVKIRLIFKSSDAKLLRNA